MRIKRLVIGITIVVSFFYCNNKNLLGPSFSFKASSWDTTFTIKSLHFPDSGIFNREIVNIGNTNRLRNFFDSMKARQVIRVGYIGGSVTAGALASIPPYCYAERFCAFLGNKFSNNQFIAINAGIGSTGSRFGCSRVEDDLLLKKPDLVIIEFTVNDALSDSTRTWFTQEGLVRRCLKEISGPVMFLLLMNSQGETFNQEMDSTIGDYYGLPVISYQRVCWPEIQSGNLLWGDVTGDGIHPNDNGHLILSYMLYTFVKKCYDTYNILDTKALLLPNPLRSAVFENAGIYKSDDSNLAISNSAWAETTIEYNRKSFAASTNGSALTINCKVHELTIGYRLMGAYNGQLEISVDDLPIDTITNSTVATGQTDNFLCVQSIFFDTSAVRSRKVTFTTLSDQYFGLNYLMFAK